MLMSSKPSQDPSSHHPLKPWALLLAGWRKDALRTLDALLSSDDAWPFAEPVPRDTEFYYDVIAHPTDLGTVRRRLDGGGFSDAGRVFLDVQQVGFAPNPSPDLSFSPNSNLDPDFNPILTLCFSGWPAHPFCILRVPAAAARWLCPCMRQCCKAHASTTGKLLATMSAHAGFSAMQL